MSTKNIREPRFIFSSDYLHMANAGKASKTITIPATAMAADVRNEWGHIDVDFPTPNGSIVSTIVQYKGASMSSPSYVLSNGSFEVRELFDNDFRWLVFWYRLNDQKIRVEYYILRFETGWAFTAPALTFTLRQQYLKAPN
jgi:hypothetical protein